MRIFADGDALPNAVKLILFRAAERLRIPLCLVANKSLRVPPSELLTTVQVPEGADGADDWIVAQVVAGDLVVTADIPLASRVVDKGGCALDPRGDIYTEWNVKERLATRDLMDQLRGAGVIQGGGPAPFTKKDSHKFACQLNAYLTKCAAAQA